jgi:hypothetical protein
VPATCPYPKSDQSNPWLQSHFLKLQLNFMLPPTPLSSCGLFHLGFPIKTLYTPLFSSIRATGPAHFTLLDLIIRNIVGKRYRSLRSSLCSFLYSSVTSPLIGPNIILGTLFSKTQSLRFSLNMNDKVFHSYKITGKIIILCILIFIFLDIKLEDKRVCIE